MSFAPDDLRAVAGMLRDAARAEILPRFRALPAHAVRAKSSPLDLVTEADVAAEAAIAAGLARAFPGATVVGEESVSRDPRALDAIGGAPLAFVVDPIDGTKNYASGLPLFGVMVAVLERGETIAGVIVDPILDEWTGAIAGGGAWVERAGGARVALHVSEPAPVDRMVGMVSWLFMSAPLKARVTANLPRTAGACDYRTAAHEYRLVAAGHYDFLLFGKLSAWDHLAGTLIHREAGGYNACLDGSPYRWSSGGEGLLCAPDEASWTALRHALAGDFVARAGRRSA